MSVSHEIAACLTYMRRILTDQVPEPNWRRITAEAYVVGTVTEVKSWYTPAGSEQAVEFDNFDLDYVNEDQELHDMGRFVTELRELTYAPERGAWYTASLAFYADRAAPTVHYNYHEQPAFYRALPLSYYRKDLQLYPRPAPLVPDWLQ